MNKKKRNTIPLLNIKKEKPKIENEAEFEHGLGTKNYFLRGYEYFPNIPPTQAINLWQMYKDYRYTRRKVFSPTPSNPHDSRSKYMKEKWKEINNYMNTHHKDLHGKKRSEMLKKARALISNSNTDNIKKLMNTNKKSDNFKKPSNKKRIIEPQNITKNKEYINEPKSSSSFEKLFFPDYNTNKEYDSLFD